MTRVARNRSYHVYSKEKLPLIIILRDILITLIAWGLTFYFCWDFLLHLTYGVLHELDTDPLNDLNWELFAKQLKISFLFSSSVLIFIGTWAIANVLLLLRTEKMAGFKSDPLPLSKEVLAYGCSVEDVKKWREQKVITASIDDTGVILEVSI